MKKLLAIFLCLFLTVSLLAVAVSASGTEEETAVCEATLKGYQNQNDGYGVRVIAEVTNIDAYSEVGFVLSNGTKEVTRAATCVFQTLIAADDKGNQYEALTAGEGSYLYALTIMGINADDALTLTVTPYTVSKEGVTLRGTEKTLTKPAGETFAVRHTVTYVCDDATVGTASVVHGERAALPTPPTGYYWSMANVGDVCNVTSDKTVTLTKVATSGYKSTQINLSSKDLTNEVKTKYSVTYSPSNALQSWAMVLYQTGQTVEWTTDAGGFVRLGGAQAKTGQHLTLGLFIDGHLWGTFTNSDMQGSVFYYADNIPVGVHTFRLEVLATSVDEGGTAFDKWNGLSFSFLQNYMTATVVYMNGSEVYDVEPVPYGGKVSAPAAPEKAGYIFDGWVLNDEVFDLGTAITGDITLTAKWVASAAEHTITFVDTEGTTISTVKVLDGHDIDVSKLPNAGTNQYYAASSEDWQKCFGVTQDETVTLTLCTNEDYPTVSDGGGLWGDSTTAKEKLNLTTSWGGAINAWKNAVGAYFTVSGDISYFHFRVALNKATTVTLKVYVDDCLTDTVTLDNSAGTRDEQTTVPVTRFLAGQHTIKVEIAEISGGGLTFVMVDARLRPAATETSSAAQMQAILVDTKENGI
ncbi:MAG: InlB B-repeat-containing protein [Clostridia bacterium]|nr:InlB B-repeat-containing protein [Clostridia bacterium]MDY6184739.1 InlB B-repeat-containing protein [Eubacteriales bacterium]